MGRNKQFDEDEALGKAMKVFWEKGYEAASIQDLVDRTGVNRASLYQTFGGKRELYLAAMERYCKGTILCKLREIDEAPSGKEAIRRFFQGIARDCACDSSGWLGCMLTNATVEMASKDERAGELAAAQLDAIEETFRKAIDRAQVAGEIPRRHSPRALARFLANSLQGMRVISMAPNRCDTLRDVVKVTLAALD